MNTRAQRGGNPDLSEPAAAEERSKPKIEIQSVQTSTSNRRTKLKPKRNYKQKKIEREKSLKSKKSKSTENKRNRKSAIEESESVLPRINFDSESRSSLDPESAQFIPESSSSETNREDLINRIVSNQTVLSNCPLEGSHNLVSSTSQTGEKIYNFNHFIVSYEHKNYWNLI